MHVPRMHMPSGFTLTELLVATTIALAIMAAVAQLFTVFSRGLSQSQATVDLLGRMRSTAWQLRKDLAGVTTSLTPPGRPESNAGYFELIEGPQNDWTRSFVTGSAYTPPTATTPRSADLEGDTDDILLFTTRSSGGPFVGRYDAETIEAPCAEVAWFVRAAATQSVPGVTTYNLYRRQLLVVGYVGKEPFLSGVNSITATLPNFTYDISLRADAGRLVPNTLGDLTKRENRFMRSGTTAFPHAFQLSADATFDNTTRVWEDVMLANVVAFDVRVFDPQARAQTTVTPALYPGDPGYVAASASGNFGAYVDLGWGTAPPATRVPTPIVNVFPPTGTTAFQSDGVAIRNSATLNILPSDTYDTWSFHYEFNGIDDDGDGVIDEANNGVDDNADGVPDNPPEYETSPPYPVRLRGLEVRLRCLEPTSRQVRQITIRHTFQRR